MASYLLLSSMALLPPVWADEAAAGSSFEVVTMGPSTLLNARAEFAAALLAETNRVRRAHGRRALKTRPELNAAADDQAAFMALILSAQHTSFLPGQHTATDRVHRRGLAAAAVAENVASYPVGRDGDPATIEQIAATLVEQWMNSPRHRANLLHREFTHFGGSVRLTRVFGGVWCAYGVQVFFSPRSHVPGRGI